MHGWNMTRGARMETPPVEQKKPLEVTNVRSYFDWTGSYMEHFEADVNREPTFQESEELRIERKIVCVTVVR